MVCMPGRQIYAWVRDEGGAAMGEFALILPLMATMLMGMWDVGNAIVAGQKMIASSQSMADLVARQIVLDDDEFDEIVQAGQLSLMPLDTEDLMIEIISVLYDDDDAPVEVWSEGVNTEVGDDLITATEGLGVDGDGTVAVRVTYMYEPTFGSHIIGTIGMQEVAFVRGRKTSAVQRSSDS